jgi:hypothetical protein
MMSARPILLAFVVVCLLVAGCGQPAAERLNAPPQGATEYPSPMQQDLTYMVDNAMLADMTVVDFHFVPHTAELNGLGARRLNRYAELITFTGGTLHYDTAEHDELLVQQRLEAIEQYLVEAGLDMSNITVKLGPAGGRGMLARDAIEIRARGTQPAETVLP